MGHSRAGHAEQPGHLNLGYLAFNHYAYMPVQIREPVHSQQLQCLLKLGMGSGDHTFHVGPIIIRIHHR